MTRNKIALTIALACAGLAVGCQRADGPNLVLITLDTTRADRLGAMGDAEARTPALDALAARGAVFERAFSSVPLTLPAHTSILTGLGPNLHGVHDNGRFVVPDSLETLAERLASQGYDTGAFVSAFVLDSGFGLDQGFDVYDDAIADRRDPLSFEVASRRGGETTERALAWLAERSGSPFFLWVHYYDAHQPLDPPPPFDEIDDRYAAEIAYMDAQVARLLDGVARAAGGREVLTIAVGDHGESQGERGEPTHGVVAYDATLHVPLIAAGPGFERGVRSAALARIEDVAPTLLAAAGLSLPRQGDAVALTSLQRGESEEERVSYFESRGPEHALGWARLGGVRTARWKLTAEPDPAELYDLLADPGETRNLADEERETVARLAEVYAERRAQVPEAAAETDSLSPEAEDLLTRLGYASAPRNPNATRRSDPRRAVASLAFIRGADGLVADGRVGDAIEALKIMTKSPAVRNLALTRLGRILSFAGRSANAVSVWEALLKSTGSPSARVELAQALIADGRADAALAALEEAASDPSGLSSSIALARGSALLVLERPDEAELAANGVLAREPDRDAALALRSRARAAREGAAAEISRLEGLLADPPAPVEHLVELRGALAGLLRGEGRLEEARTWLEMGFPPPSHLRAIAEITAEAGDREQAVRLYEALTQRFPAMLSARRDLAELYGRVGRVDDELALYGELIELDPLDATLLVDRGVVLYRAQRRDDALRDFRAASIADAELPEAAFNLGLLYFESGRDGEAEGQLLRAIELRPDYAKAHFHLARVYRGRGDPRAATNAEKAVQGNPAVSSGPPRLAP